MENAGQQASHHVLDLAAERSATRAVILCGTGNNGGDGLVIARHLLGRLDVSVFLLGERTRIVGDAARNRDRLDALACKMIEIDGPADVVHALSSPGVVLVDAIFGTGLDRPIEGFRRSVIEAVVDCGTPTIAIDVPSGLDADTGAVLGAAIRATRTLSFVASKRGFLLDQGPRHCGAVTVLPIGFPPDAATPAL